MSEEREEEHQEAAKQLVHALLPVISEQLPLILQSGMRRFVLTAIFEDCVVQIELMPERDFKARMDVAKKKPGEN